MCLGLPAGRSVGWWDGAGIVQPAGISVGWWNGTGISQRLFVFFASNWPSSSVLHSVKQRSKDKSMSGCKYGYGIMIWKYASVPIYIRKMDQDEIPINIYLDLSKAFDTIDHLILIDKLKYYSIL